MTDETAPRSTRADVLDVSLVTLYLALAVAVEAIVAGAPPFDSLPGTRALQIAVLLDGLLLASLLVQGAIQLAGRRPAVGHLFMGLALIPLARIVAQGLTFGVTVPGMGIFMRFYFRLFLVAIALLVGLYFVVRAARVDLRRPGQPLTGESPHKGLGRFLGVLVLLIAPTLGFMAHAVLDPVLPTVGFDDPRIGFAVVALVLAALWQELTFRGVILRDANRVFGWIGATVVSAVAGTILLVGTVPSFEAAVWGVLAAQLALGFLLAAQAQVSQSLAAVVPAQALLQIAYFLVAPHYA